IQTSQRHDYDAFVRAELKQRSILSYPPFCRLILVTLSHEQLPKLVQTSERFAAELRDIAGREGLLRPLDDAADRALELLGPVASPIPRLKDRYRFQCMIKYRGNIDAAALVRLAMTPYVEGAPAGSVLFSVDVDPQMIL